MSTPDNRNSKRSSGNNKENQNGPKFNTILPIAVLAVVFVLLINFLYSTYAASRMEEIKYNEFEQMLEEDQIAEAEIREICSWSSPKRKTISTRVKVKTCTAPSPPRVHMMASMLLSVSAQSKSSARSSAVPANP